jgi:hypothetical protein
MKSTHGFLRSIQIASPCSASWDAMSGNERARFCDQCEKHVYDLSTMTAAEAVALIQEREGKLCGRLWRRLDGTVLTADCPVGVQRVIARKRQRASLAAASLLSLGLLNVACGAKKLAIVPSLTAEQEKSRKKIATAKVAKEKSEACEMTIGVLAIEGPESYSEGGSTHVYKSKFIDKLPIR